LGGELETVNRKSQIVNGVIRRSIVRLRLMALSRSSVNLVFALIVAVLGSTAVVFIYFNSGMPDIRTQAAVDSRLPEKNAPAEVATRITALQQMSTGDPKNPDYPVEIGNIYYDLGQYDKAAEYYQRSLGIRPHDPNVETDLATCFHYLGQDDKSLETLDDVLSFAPGFSQAKYNKGIVLIEGKKDAKGAISIWEDLLRSDPGYRQRAELQQRIDQLKASIR
jgi:tetratricopeptide (TPR) repeat protein